MLSFASEIAVQYCHLKAFLPKSVTGILFIQISPNFSFFSKVLFYGLLLSIAENKKKNAIFPTIDCYIAKRSLLSYF